MLFILFQECLQRSFKAEVYTCPACRHDLGKNYSMTVNKSLQDILNQFFPGYSNGRWSLVVCSALERKPGGNCKGNFSVEAIKNQFVLIYFFMIYKNVFFFFFFFAASATIFTLNLPWGVVTDKFKIHVTANTNHTPLIQSPWIFFFFFLPVFCSVLILLLSMM